MEQLIASVIHGVRAALTEITTLGRTLKQRATDALAYFDRPGTVQRIDRERSTDDSNTSAAPRLGSAT